MLKNYIKVAFRSLVKQRGLSVINVAGLSLGLASFCLFLLYAVNEFSFDRFHENEDRIYRVYRWTEPMFGEDAQGDASLPLPLAPAMKADFPDVEDYVRFRQVWGGALLKVGDRTMRRSITFADPSFFSVFTFPLAHGNAETALANPGNMVLSKTEAQNLFGLENPLGKEVEVQLDGVFQTFTVVAVAENPPANSTITFDVLLSFNKFKQTSRGRSSIDNWGRSAFSTFVLLQPGSNLPNEAGRLHEFRARYYPNEAQLFREDGWNEDYPPVSYKMLPMSEVHTNTQVLGAFVDPVDTGNIWILLSIAAGVLLIACINFTTLAIGRSANRAREVGVRKAIGSNRMQLATQFMVEALILTLLAAGLGYLIAQLFLPSFSAFTGRELAFSFQLYPELWGLLIGLIVVVGIMAGGYPALILSGLQPIQVLKSNVKIGGANLLTKALVLVQFVVSIGLILSMVVILHQVSFLQEKNPGFQKENVLVINGAGTDLETAIPRLKNNLSQNPNVLGVASAEIGLGAGSGWSRVGWEYNEAQKNTYEYYVDYNYLDVLGLELAAGRNFNPAITSDTTSSILVNEAFVRDMGWTNEAALGQALPELRDLDGEAATIIGVVKDFHFRSYHETVTPQYFQQFSNMPTPARLFVRIQPGNPAPVIKELEQAWKAVAPELAFDYYFLDDSFDAFYRTEAQFGQIISWAGGLAIFLACLGLFGLATLAVVNRQKEIGVRKILGASNLHLMKVLNKDFLILVGVAICIAIPIAWYLMSGWLESFAYRINVSPGHMLIAGGFVMGLTLLTVSFQALRASHADPVEVLRSE